MLHHRQVSTHNLDLDGDFSEGKPWDEDAIGPTVSHWHPEPRTPRGDIQYRHEDSKPKFLHPDQRMGVPSPLAMLDIVCIPRDDEHPGGLSLAPSQRQVQSSYPILPQGNTKKRKHIPLIQATQ